MKPNLLGMKSQSYFKSQAVDLTAAQIRDKTSIQRRHPLDGKFTTYAAFSLKDHLRPLNEFAIDPMPCCRAFSL